MVETVKAELAAEVARNFGELRLRVAGCSMLPTLLPGDILTIARCDADTLKIGEIVQIVLYDRLVCHRLIQRAGGVFVTQGDAAPNPDPAITQKQILGRVTDIRRNGHAIHPELTLQRRVAGNILRRSGISARILWRLRRNVWAAAEPTRAS